MKHLKKYNENINDISLQDIRDICLELEDEKFIIELNEGKSAAELLANAFNISIESGKEKNFKYSEVKEVLLRLKDYLGEKLIFVSALIPLANHVYNSFDVILFNEEEFRCKGHNQVCDFRDHAIRLIKIYFKL